MSQAQEMKDILDPKFSLDAVKQMHLHEGLNAIEGYNHPDLQINVEVKGGKVVEYVWTEKATGRRLPSFALKGVRRGAAANPEDEGSGDFCAFCCHFGPWAHCWRIPCEILA